MDLYTIKEMAKVLKIPESTARYYRDRHSEFLPHIGSGRKDAIKRAIKFSRRMKRFVAHIKRSRERSLLNKY